MCKTKPKEFISLNEKLKQAIFRMDYATENNFTGKKIPGYNSTTAYFTNQAYQALAKANEVFLKDGYGLIIFDTYRPLKAVKYFYEQWRIEPLNLDLKKKYFPNLSKDELFKFDYLSKQSSHCRGSTIDLGLYSLKSGNDLDFGTIFDFFSTSSHSNDQSISITSQVNRAYLIKIMQEHGFKNYHKEWWHFTLNHEPFADTYFDFNID